MNFLSLEYFTKVAEEKSIRKAAAELYVSEQAVSSAIKKLEDELNLVLLKRTRPMSLTDAGKVFYRHAVEILRIRNTMMLELKATKEAAGFTIGIVDYGAPPFLADITMLYEEHYPQTELRFLSGNSAEMLSRTDINVYIMPFCKSPDFVSEHLIDDHLCIVTSRALMKRIYGSDAEHISEEYKKTHNLALLHKLPFLRTLEDVWKLIPNLPFEPEYVRSLSINFVALDFCRNGTGALLCPMDAILRQIRDMRQEEAENLLIFEIPDAIFPLNLYIRKSVSLSLSEQRFVQLLKDYFK